jgi:hypothetical protein
MSLKDPNPYPNPKKNCESESEKNEFGSTRLLYRDEVAELRRRRAETQEEKSFFLQDIDRIRSQVDTNDKQRRNTLICKKFRIKR